MALIKENAPFASALLEIGQEEGKQKEFLDELLDIKKVMSENPEFATVLRYPGIGKQEKTEMLESVFKDQVDPRVMQFLKVLCLHRKAGDIAEIADAYEQLYDKAQGIERVNVFTATPLSKAQTDRLKLKLEKQLHHSIRMEVHTDPALIAGLKIVTEDSILDNTVRGRLDNMKDQLMKAEG